MLDRLWNSQTRYLLREAVLFFLLAHPLTYGGKYTGGLFYPMALVNTAAIALIGTIWLAWRGLRRRPFPRTELDLPLAVLLGAWALAVIFSIDPRRSMPAFSQLLVYTLLFYLVVDLVRSGWKAELFVKVILIASSFQVIFGGLELFSWYRGWLDAAGWENTIPLATTRIHGTLNHPNLLASFLSIALLLGLARLFQSKTRWKQAFLGVWSLILLFLLYMTSSRSGWLGAAAGMLVLGALLALDRAPQMQAVLRRLAAKKIAIFAGLALLLILTWAGIGMVSYQANHPNHSSSRSYIWIVAWEAFIKSPLTGLGPLTYSTEFIDRYPVPPMELLGHAHNYWLHTLGEAGLLGLAALLWVGTALALALVRRWRRLQGPQRTALAGAAACLAAASVHSIFETPQFVPAISVILAIVLALALGPKPLPAQRRRLRSGNIALAGVFGLALGLLCLPLPAQHRQYQGILAASRDGWQEAAQRLDQAAEQDPNLALYWFQDGFAHGMLALDEDGSAKDPAELEVAIAAYERGLEIEPAYPGNWANLAALHWAAGSRADATAAMEEAHRQSPNMPAFALTLGAYYEAQGRAQEASAVYTQALNLDAALRRSPFFRQTALRQQAARAWQASLPAPQSPEGLAWAALEDGDPAAAQQMFAALTGLNRASAQLGLGLAYLEQGRLEAARHALRTAHFQSGLLRVKLALGDVHHRLGETDRAVQYYEEVLHLVERSGFWGAGRKGDPQYAGLIFLRDDFYTDLLPGITLGQYSDDILSGMAELVQLYHANGRVEQADQLQTRLDQIAAGE